MPSVCVVIPVFDRPGPLRRALASVLAQTVQDWECLVVDDASTEDLSSVVDEFADPRIRVIRREENGGPAAARLSAFSQQQSRYLLCLDSDWVLYPWALAQGLHHFGCHPEAEQVTGLCLRDADSRLFVRVANAPRIVTPQEFRNERPVPDRVAMVSAAIVREWCELPGRFFAFEAALWTTTSLRHDVLTVDEPWVIYHTDTTDRVTNAMGTSVGRERQVADAIEFLRTRGDLVAAGPCVTVDLIVEGLLFLLVRNRRREATLAARALRARGISPARALLRIGAERFSRRLRRGWRLADEPVRWV